MEGHKHIHFIGICGIGMSALAQLLCERGTSISGSDRDPSSEVCGVLESCGITVLAGQDAQNIPEETDLVIYSDAVYEDNPERVEAKRRGIPEMSYFKALGEVSKQATTTIAVAGTHGKTTTTAMLVKILKDAGKNPTAVIGSIVRDFESNFVSGSPDLFVVEACEYRDHLLELDPQYLVITNLEWDHTDWFKTEAQLKETFQEAIDRVPEDGKVIDASVYQQEPEYEIGLIGEFNQENARAAASAARAAFPDISEEQIRESLKTFKGAWRRFEYKGETNNGAMVYDDYAHHPTEIEKTIVAAREKFSDKNITVAFHPHLYSRTQAFFDEFVEALSCADQVILAPIYAAREENPGNISSELLAEKIGEKAIALPNFEEVTKALEECGEDDLIITMGAGDIYKVADAIVKI